MKYEYMKSKMQEYLLTLDNCDKDEWYCTDRYLHEVGLEGFMDWLQDNA